MKTSDQIHRASNNAAVHMWKNAQDANLIQDKAIISALNHVQQTGAFNRTNDVRACTEGKAPFITVWIACGQSIWMVHTNTDTAEAYIQSYQP